jgi:hypothetical protein
MKPMIDSAGFRPSLLVLLLPTILITVLIAVMLISLSFGLTRTAQAPRL